MAVDFRTAVLGSNRSNNNNTSDRPKAQLWLNIGYVAEVATDDGFEERFVSLPQGIPIDQVEALQLRGNDDFRAFTAARNDLMDQIMAVAEGLAPGEDKILNLQIQLRRVADEAVAPKAEENAYARKLAL